MKLLDLKPSEHETAKDLYKNYLDRFDKLKFDNLISDKINKFTFEEYIKYDIERCDMCNEIEDSFYLIDDEGFRKGGNGCICPNCRNDGD